MDCDCIEIINDQRLNDAIERRKKRFGWWQEASPDFRKRFEAETGWRRRPIPSPELILQIDNDPIVQLLNATLVLSSSVSEVIDRIRATTGVDVKTSIPGMPIIPFEWYGLCVNENDDQITMWQLRLTYAEYDVYPPLYVLRHKITELKDRLRQFSPIKDYVDQLQEDEQHLIR